MGCTLVGFAKQAGIMATVSLEHLTMIREDEKGGDELYLDVTAYPTKTRPTHVQIPEFPEYWMSGYAKEVKNVVLWKGRIPNNDTTTIVLSLVDRDIAPWNVDDVLGTVQVVLKNNNGTLETLWKKPNVNDQPIVMKNMSAHKQLFNFNMIKGSDYKVTYVVNPS
jgi:hypothetical protein